MTGVPCRDALLGLAFVKERASMRKFFGVVVKNPKKILTFFITAAVICAVLKGFVSVNYDMKDYLPEDSASTVALDKMKSEFDGGIPNARVMIKDVTLSEAMQYKEKLKNLEIQVEIAKQEVEKPFPREEELKEKSARLDQLNILLNMDKRENEIVDGVQDEGEIQPQRESRGWDR